MRLAIEFPCSQTIYRPMNPVVHRTTALLLVVATLPLGFAPQIGLSLPPSTVAEVSTCCCQAVADGQGCCCAAGPMESACGCRNSRPTPTAPQDREDDGGQSTRRLACDVNGIEIGGETSSLSMSPMRVSTSIFPLATRSQAILCRWLI